MSFLQPPRIAEISVCFKYHYPLSQGHNFIGLYALFGQSRIYPSRRRTNRMKAQDEYKNARTCETERD